MKVFDVEVDRLEYDFNYNTVETDELHQKLNGSTEVTINDLRRVSLWKSNRVLNVDSDTLACLNQLGSVSNLTLESPLVKEVIERLVLSQGIGFPMASAVLKFINPNLFPIIDVRAYRALTGKKPYYLSYTYDGYISYAVELHRLAQILNRPLRDIDEQLYCFDKENNGKI